MNVDVIQLRIKNETTARLRDTTTPVAQVVLCATAAITSVVILTVLFDAECHSKFRSGLFSPYFSMIMSAIYAWQFAILQARFAWHVKQLCFALVVAASLPFIYWRCFPLPTIESGTLVHCIANPVWVLPIPIATFYMFRRTRFRELSEMQIFRFVALVVLALFAWSVVCSLSLIYAGLAANWHVSPFHC